MEHRMTGRSLPGKVLPHTLLLALLLVAAHAIAVAPGNQQASQEKVDRLSAQEFSRLVQEFSEEGGYFQSDNFTSNETSYLQVVQKLRQLHASGDAYLGVGPEQNFTYIAKLRPKIAFIVDIRRQAMLQHLLYKALFHVSETRAQFLSGLLSRPLTGEQALRGGASVDELIDYFRRAEASEEASAANLKRIRRIIQDEFRVPLSEGDQSSLEFVYSTFRTEGLGISTRAGRNGWGGRSPTLADLIAQPDQTGKPGNFLATEEDYRFVRSMQTRNRIIPIVGDFGGRKALAAVADYLRRNGYTVAAFYTSNVEQYLLQNGSFAAFAENVRKLPVDESSVFIRAVLRMSQTHPARLPDHRTVTLLQKIPVFLRGFDEGRYPDYWSLVTTDFIATEQR